MKAIFYFSKQGNCIFGRMEGEKGLLGRVPTITTHMAAQRLHQLAKSGYTVLKSRLCVHNVVECREVTTVTLSLSLSFKQVHDFI